VGYILEKQKYMGHTILGKTICENYKTKKRRKDTADELIIFKNTHTAIVDEETWHNTPSPIVCANCVAMGKIPKPLLGRKPKHNPIPTTTLDKAKLKCLPIVPTVKNSKI